MRRPLQIRSRSVFFFILVLSSLLTWVLLRTHPRHTSVLRELPSVSPNAESGMAHSPADHIRHALIVTSTPLHPLHTSPLSNAQHGYGATTPLFHEVRGTVVDVEGRGIPNVAIRLQMQAPLLSEDVARDEPLPSYETHSEPDGSWAVIAPADVPSRALLSIAPGSHHQCREIRFGHASAHSFPPLSPGVTDLGEIMLASTGRVSGRVRDGYGRPISGALIRVAHSVGALVGPCATTYKDGTYAIENVPVGSQGVLATAEGFQATYRWNVLVRSAETTDHVDLALANSPLLGGQVTDKVGRPLSGALLTSMPITDGLGSTARSGAEGVFTLYLQQNEAHTLTCSLSGYQTFKSEHLNANYLPEDVTIHIALAEAATCRFIIVDDSDQAPINYFALRLVEASHDLIAWYDLRSKIEFHHEGLEELFLQDRHRHYQIVAPGYAPSWGPIGRLGHGDSRVITMTRGSSIHARVLCNGYPAVGASIRIRNSLADEYSTSADSGLPRPREVINAGCDLMGTFHVEGLLRGTYELLAFLSTGEMALIEPVLVPGDAGIIDLGDIALHSPASLEGHISPPNRTSKCNTLVSVQQGSFMRTTTTNADGVFAFRNLPSGSYKVGAYSNDPPCWAYSTVELGPGNSAVVNLDLGWFSDSFSTDDEDVGPNILLPVDSAQSR